MAQGRTEPVTPAETLWIADVLHRTPSGVSDLSPFLGRGMGWVNRWLAETVQPSFAALARAAGADDSAQIALGKAHQGAADGVALSQAAWHALLEPAFLQMFRLAYPYDEAFEIAHISALAFAGAHREMIDEAFGSAEAYAQYYAELNTGRSQDFASAAQAQVHAAATAKALACESSALFAASGPQFRLRSLLVTVEKLCPFAPDLCGIPRALGVSLEQIARG